MQGWSQYHLMLFPYKEMLSCVVFFHPDVEMGTSALSKCSVSAGSIVGIVGSNCQVPLPAKGLLVKSSVE